MIKIEIVHNSFTFSNEKLLLFITFDVTSFMKGPFYNVTRAKKKSDGHFERLDIPSRYSFCILCHKISHPLNS